MNALICEDNMSCAKSKIWGRYNQSSFLWHHIYWRDWLAVEETLALHPIFAHLKERTPQKKQIIFLFPQHNPSSLSPRTEVDLRHQSKGQKLTSDRRQGVTRKIDYTQGSPGNPNPCPQAPVRDYQMERTKDMRLDTDTRNFIGQRGKEPGSEKIWRGWVG